MTPEHIPTSRPVGPQSQVLHYSYEKAGLILDNQPIPWNAEAVLVEAAVRLSQVQPKTRAEFGLHLPGQAPLAVDRIRSEAGVARLFFRLPVPSHTVMAELFSRERSLGQLTLPILPAQEFRDRLTLQQATVHVQWKDETVACQSFVTTQGRGLIASALLSSPTSLAPLADFDLRVELGQHETTHARQPIRLSSSQLRSRQALVSVSLPRLTKSGVWQVRWLLGEQVLATVSLRAITPKALEKSLRLTEGRCLVEDLQGKIHILRYPPTTCDDVARMGPVFLVSSNLPGMAAMCELEVRAEGPELKKPLVIAGQTLRISDGPTPFAPGTFSRNDLTRIKTFSLWCGGHEIGKLSIAPIPVADFTGEGGFQTPVEDFAWSPLAEEQLFDRLGKLLDGD